MASAVGGIIDGYEWVLRFFAEIVIYSLELVGIVIIVAGSVKAVGMMLRRFRGEGSVSVVNRLGRSLSLALEFKMGAEIVNTVIVRELNELGILAVVILIRALLAFIIHWEMKAENEIKKKDSELK